MKKNALICLISIFVCLLMVGCSFNKVNDIELSFYDDEGATFLYKTTLFKYKSTPYVPADKNDMTFNKWYLDPDLTKEADFNKIKKDTVLYAGWKKKASDKLYYTVAFFLDNDLIKSMKVSSKDEIVKPEDPKKSGYVFTGWSDIPDEITRDVVVYARFAKLYTVKFFADKDDTTPWQVQEVKEGENAKAPDTNPIKIGDEQYYYTFSKWDTNLNNVQNDLNVYAQFTRQVHKYNCVFKNYDGSILSNKTLEYGSKFTPPTPTRPSDDVYIYQFIGWSLNGDDDVDELPSIITCDIEAIALYSQNLKSFKVNFYVEDVLIYTEDVEYGEKCIYLGDTPQKEPTVQCVFVFSGWDQELDNITSNLEVHALFVEKVRNYTYSFIDCNGLVVSDTKEYGSEIIVPTPTQKENDVYYMYPFSHWLGDDGSILEGESFILDRDITFSAVYLKKNRTFTYKFMYGIDEILSVSAEYGTVIVPPDPPESTDGSIFIKWIGYTEGMILEKDEIFYAYYE